MDHGLSEHGVNGEPVNLYLRHCYMSLSDGQSVTWLVVNLIQGGKGHNVGVCIQALPLMDPNTNVVHPVVSSIYESVEHDLSNQKVIDNKFNSICTMQ